MTPYYEDERATIYHARCEDVLPSLPAAAIVTDPPYGIGYNPSRSRQATEPGRDRSRWASKEWGRVDGDDRPFDPSPLLGHPELILWGANNYAEKIPPSNGWLFWDKERADGFAGGDGELAWTNVLGSVRRFSLLWDGFRRGSDHGLYYHPTQKPVALMQWCIGFTSDNLTVLDPFMGSGTTLVAAKNLGRKAIGVEVEERYCEIAAERLSQGVLNLTAPEAA